MTKRFGLIGGTAALLCCTTFFARPAHADGHWRVRGRVDAGAVVAGAAVGLAVGALLAPPPPPPPVVVHTYAPYYGARVVVAPAPPPPVMVVSEPPQPGPTIGISLSGVAQSLPDSDMSTSGGALSLQLRTSPHAMFSLELQSLQAERAWDGLRRSDAAVLVGTRLFPWDWTLSPFLDLAAGVGQASFRCCAFEEHASQFLGRYGLGVELRLGRHVALDAQVSEVHRWRLDDPGLTTAPVADHERAAEVRAGLALLF